MVSSSGEDRECTVLCRSLQHASQAVDCVIAIASAKFTVEEVKVYLRHLCWNFYSQTDALGRSVLHAAASVGNVELIEWLIDAYDCDPNKVDAESGWSALHRAAFFGWLGAVWVLLGKGASVDLKDHEGLTPMDILVRDRVPWAEYLPTKPCSLHVWGEDENLSLGLGTITAAETPKAHPRFPLASGIREAVIEKFHSVFLTEDHKALVCGHGLGGRLGVGDEKTLMVPEELRVFRRLNVKIVQAAAGQDHTIFLDSEGSVYTCGSNKYLQLGFSARPDKLVEPQAVNPKTFLLNPLETIRGVGAGKYHSALFTERALYTWGLNAGQLGHPKHGERFTILPRKVAAIDLSADEMSSSFISMISCGEGAIGALTTDGDVYLVHDYQVKKVISKSTDISKIAVVGGNIDHERILGDSSKCTDLKLLTLNDSGNIFVWEGRNLLHSRVRFEMIIKVADLAVSIDGSLLIVSGMGEVLKGHLGRSVSTIEAGWSSKSSSRKHCSRTVTVNNLKRVPGLHRAVAVRCDPRGKRFVALQNGPNEGVRSLDNFDLEKSGFSEDLLSMLNAESSFSDVQVVCVSPDTQETKEFDLHSVVLQSRSAFFKRIISEMRLRETSEDGMKIQLTGVSGDEFSELIPAIYHGTIGSTEFLLKHRSALEIIELNFSTGIERTSPTDTQIRSADGEVVNAHRCLLAARSDYFKCMFARDWQEASSGQLTLPVATETLMAVIEYLYTDTCLSVQTSGDINFICDVLAFADHLLLSRLKSICENELFSRLMSVQNVCELFELAKFYQADRLLQVCAEFICVNLTAVLESEGADHLSVDSWDGLSVEYRTNSRDCLERVIGGCGFAPSEERIQQIYKNFKSVLAEDDVLVKTAENLRISLANKTKTCTPSKRRFQKPKIARPKALSEPVQSDAIVEHRTDLNEVSNETNVGIPSEGFPVLGEIQLQKKLPRSDPASFKQVPQRIQKRMRYRSIDSITPPVAVTKCPWSPNNNPESGGTSSTTKSQSLEETMELETRYKEHMASFSLDKADAEDRAMADLAIVYEIGSNPDERVSIQREIETSVPVWSVRTFR